MKKNTIMKKVASGVLAGGMLLSLTTAVWADDASDTALQCIGTGSMYQRMGAAAKVGNQNFGKNFALGNKQGVMGEQFADVLQKLVENGDITQDKADKISTFIKERAAVREEHQQEMRETITANRDKLNNMTPEERRDYIKSLMEERDIEREPIFQELIDEGTLSESEVEVIREKIREYNQTQNEERKETRWASYVEKGIITDGEKDEILEYLADKSEERRAERQADWDEIKNMTTEERREYKQEKMEARKNQGRGAMQAELVEAGILTQDQADQIQKLNQGDRANAGKNMRMGKERGMGRGLNR